MSLLLDIDAVQITDATFDAPHPNPTHVPGVIYNPKLRNVRVPTPHGDILGFVGDWIARQRDGGLTILSAQEHKRQEDQ